LIFALASTDSADVLSLQLMSLVGHRELVAGTVGGTKSRSESENRRQPSQRVKPEAKAEEGSLAASEDAKDGASRKLFS
jgi:hypothetical protein